MTGVVIGLVNLYFIFVFLNKCLEATAMAVVGWEVNYQINFTANKRQWLLLFSL